MRETFLSTETAFWIKYETDTYFVFSNVLWIVPFLI